MVGIQPYSLAFRRLMNWRPEPKEELGNERKRLCRKAGWQWEAGWPVGWPPFQLFETRFPFQTTDPLLLWENRATALLEAQEIMRAAAIVPLLVRFQRHASLGSRRGMALTECGELERAGIFIESAARPQPKQCMGMGEVWGGSRCFARTRRGKEHSSGPSPSVRLIQLTTGSNRRPFVAVK
jgi:hypothetical protein